MKICAAIPTYNHADRLDGIIDRLPDGLDALVIDDGSNPPIATRSPRATLVRFGRTRGVEIVQLPIPALYDSESLEGSHYKPFADTLKFTAMNTKLFFASLLLPKKTLRKLALKK